MKLIIFFIKWYCFLYFCKNIFSPLQKVITYSLLVIFSFAYSYETISYFSKALGDNSISWLANFDWEENDSESEKSNEKNEKLNFSEDFFFNLKHNNIIPGQLDLRCLGHKQYIDFSSSDYSQQVYSPPEIL